ncbi:hypothetical protein ACFE04_025850 [Oxalis oulophora]
MNRVRFFGKTERSSTDRKIDRSKPILKRSNAARYVEYEAAVVATAATSCSSSLDNSASSSNSLVTQSLNIPDRTSFRVEGNDGEFDRIFKSMGLTGPDDFAIPALAWEAMKLRSSSEIIPRSRFDEFFSPRPDESIKVEVSQEDKCLVAAVETELTRRESPELNESQMVIACGSEDGGIEEARVLERDIVSENYDRSLMIRNKSGSSTIGLTKPPVVGIKGARPPLLKRPPAMTLPLIDNTCSTWDLFRDFGPTSEQSSPQRTGFFEQGKLEQGIKNDDEAAAEGKRVLEEERDMRIGETIALSESCSFSTTNDDDSSSSTTTEPPSNNSPAGTGRLRIGVGEWEKGELLGRGSFGSVYECISHTGVFFAVKEVSLLDQGSQGKQSIYQLEQEISLLSQFEHENIVLYYGTERDESTLYIFLELVKGSLLNLYQTYNLKDSQVSAYTRQILRGLKYLHDRNVIHRDIKCANILVHTSGSVKLADFGLAKATKLNDVKSCKGTAFWMAPEVVNRKGQGYGLPADIWSLGCTVLEMLTGKIPYSDLEWMQAMYKIGNSERPHVPETLSEEARDFILQCLRVNPNDRPTAGRLLDHPFVKVPLTTYSCPASPYTGRRS